MNKFRPKDLEFLLPQKKIGVELWPRGVLIASGILIASLKNHLHIPVLLGMSAVFVPTKNVTPDAGQNPGATKIPLPLRAGDKSGTISLLFIE